MKKEWMRNDSEMDQYIFYEQVFVQTGGATLKCWEKSPWTLKYWNDLAQNKLRYI